ncbi:hypothetical protein VPH35_095920 [Triticum aestivum]
MPHHSPCTSRRCTSAVEMPERTMGGRADAMAHKASKPRAKLHKEKPIPAGEGSNRQQGGLDVMDHVQATPEQVAPPPEQVTPLPRHLPPPPQPIVNVDGGDDGEEVAPLASLPEHVVAPQPQPGIHLPLVLPPLPPPTVVADENEEEVLSDDVDSDPETQRIYRRQKVRELDSGVLEKRVRPRIGRGATDALTATS